MGIVALLPAGQLAATELFVVAGQSNAVGAGTRTDELPPELLAPRADIPFWFEEGAREALTDPTLRISSAGLFQALQPQSDPSGTLFWETGDGFGPELGVGPALASALQEEVAILKFAIGGSSLPRDWLPGTGGTVYPEMRRAVRRALAALRRSGRRPRLAGVFWIQGEADALLPEPAANYRLYLGALITRLRNEFGPPHLPFVFARLPAGLALPYAAEVRAAQQDVVRLFTNTALVDTDDLATRPDGLHYDSSATLALGRRLAGAYLAPPSLVASDLLIAEAGARSRARMRVSLAGINRSGASVSHATVDGTARAGEDYLAASGTLRFAPGVASRVVAVRILGDAAPEPDEEFSLQLSGAVGATLDRSRAVCVIRDDDGP
jgi:hypothetical protein